MHPPQDTGYIALHRRIMRWEWYADGNTMRVFLHLLLLANHKATKWRGEVIERGQVITGRHQLSRDLKISERGIRTALDHLKSTNELTIKTTNKYSIITITNYSAYQDWRPAERPTKRPAERPSNDQRPTTSNNEKKKNNTHTLPSSSPVGNEVVYRTIGKHRVGVGVVEGLVQDGFSWPEIDSVLDDIENEKDPDAIASVPGLMVSWLKARRNKPVPTGVVPVAQDPPKEQSPGDCCNNCTYLIIDQGMSVCTCNQRRLMVRGDHWCKQYERKQTEPTLRTRTN